MQHNRHCFSNIYTLMHEGVNVTKTVENGFERGGGVLCNSWKGWDKLLVRRGTSWHKG